MNTMCLHFLMSFHYWKHFSERFTDDKKMAASQKERVEKLKKKVSDFQADLRAEIRKNQANQGDGRQWSIRGGGTRNIEKIRKKLREHVSMTFFLSCFFTHLECFFICTVQMSDWFL